MIQTPKIGIEQFWESLGGSGLLPSLDFDRIKKQASTLQSGSEDPEAIAKWLVKEKILTPLQLQVVLAGHIGPFDFGRYRLVSRSDDASIWKAVDRKTGHPVWLHFFPGTTRDDLSPWNEVELRADGFATLDHPNLVRVYESIVTRTHRFVATAVGGKETLANKMPLKRRLTEDQGLSIVREVAVAVKELQSHGLQHGSLNLEHVYTNAKQGTSRVLLPVVSQLSDPVPDINSLGRMLFRLLSGREAPTSEKLIKAGVKKFTDTLSKRNISPQSCELIFESIAADDSFSAKTFLDRIDTIIAKDIEPQAKQALPSEAAFLAALTPWETERKLEEAVPELTPAKIGESLPTTEYRKTRRIPVGVSIGLTLFGFAMLLGLGAMVANLKKLPPPRTIAEGDVKNADPVEARRIAAEAAETKRKQLAELLATQSYVQEIIPDNQQTIWESPTTGFPIDISSLPPSPRIIAAVNWKSIYDSEAGVLSIRALGPRTDSLLRNLETRIGFELAQLDSTVISLHSNLAFEYDSFVAVTLSEPDSLESCLEKWNQPDPIPGIENGFGTPTGNSWWVSKTVPETGEVISFVVGTSELVQQVARGETASLTGTLRDLVASSDSNRDVSLILPVISLFNTEGQKLFYDQRKWMNELRLVLPQSVVGLSVSLHHDGADYLEIRADHTADLKSGEAATLMQERIKDKLEQTGLAIQQRQALPYWEPVRARFGAMIRDLSQQLRWNSEFGEVIGNAWLPPGALHNLFAGTELAMTFEPAQAKLAGGATKSATPQTLTELLATRRDLKIANPPDLNVLLRNIKEEISDQYLDLPFEFNIRIAGTDLQKDGITQNQRPGALEITDQSVSEILTSVMVSANPNREISGPSDPKCKLVWVITEDENSPGEKFVLVTTRAAAAEKGYALPDAFKVKP